MNSTVRLIFNEKIAENCNLWVRKQYTKILFTKDLVNNRGLKKKKKENAKRKNVDAQTHNPNTYYVIVRCKILKKKNVKI